MFCVRLVTEEETVTVDIQTTSERIALEKALAWKKKLGAWRGALYTYQRRPDSMYVSIITYGSAKWSITHAGTGEGQEKTIAERGIKNGTPTSPPLYLVTEL